MKPKSRVCYQFNSHWPHCDIITLLGFTNNKKSDRLVLEMGEQQSSIFKVWSWIGCVLHGMQISDS